MSYDSAPLSAEVKLSPAGNTVAIENNIQSQAVPPAIHKLLTERLGWNSFSNHPDTYEPLYQKDDMGNFDANDGRGLQHQNLTGDLYFHWYEAMAYEYAKMIHIGLDE